MPTMAVLFILDEKIGCHFASFSNERIVDNTITIIVGDHGEHFGEHDLLSHANSLYLPVLHVPLIVLLPQQAQASSTINDSLVSLRDLPATILALTGITGSSIPGGVISGLNWKAPVGGIGTDCVYSSLKSRWGPKVDGDSIVAGRLHSLVQGDLHFLNEPHGSDELYDLKRDPLEEHDLSKTDDGRYEIKRFRERLAAILRHTINLIQAQG